MPVLDCPMPCYGKSWVLLTLFGVGTLFSSAASANLPTTAHLRALVQKEVDHGTHRVTYVRIRPASPADVTRSSG